MSETRLPEIAVQDSGSGPAVLLLHAFPLNSGMWEEQRRVLGEGYRVLSYDFPGFGQSPPPEGPLTLSDVAQGIAHDLRARGIRATAAVGLSLGGYLLLELVRQNPVLFTRLILADTRAEPDTAEGKQRREMVASRSEREGVAHLLGMIPSLLSSRPSPRVERVVHDLILRATPQGVAAASRAMGLRRDQRDLLPTIPCPTLVMVGGDDTITPEAMARSMAEAIPDAELRVLPGAGHLSNLEAADSFNRALLSFL